jgi:hypothetical protein
MRMLWAQGPSVVESTHLLATKVQFTFPVFSGPERRRTGTVGNLLAFCQR